MSESTAVGRFFARSSGFFADEDFDHRVVWRLQALGHDELDRLECLSLDRRRLAPPPAHAAPDSLWHRTEYVRVEHEAKTCTEEPWVLPQPQRAEVEFDRVEGLGADLRISLERIEQRPVVAFDAVDLERAQARVDEPDVTDALAAVDS